MTPIGEKYNRSPKEWDQAEPDWNQEAHEKDLKAAKEWVDTGGDYLGKLGRE